MWRPIVGFAEGNKLAAQAEYGPVPQVNVSEEDLSAIRRLRYIADKIERGEDITRELDYLMGTRLILVWRDKQPKPSRSGWGNV